MVEHDQLEVIAVAARRFVEPVWYQWHEKWNEIPNPLSRWTCGRSSLFLQRVYREDFGLAADWKSGAPRFEPEGPDIGQFGYFSEIRWESHSWVRVGLSIVDITADQFGEPKIVVTMISDARYREGPSDTALPEYVANRAKAVNQIWPHWLISNIRAELF